MRRYATLLPILFLFPVLLTAQSDPTALQTITSGPFNDRNPVLARSVSFWLGSGAQWMLFERNTADSSFIMGKQYVVKDHVWDSAEVVIAASSAAFPLILPDIASANSVTSHSYAVWVRTGGATPEVYGANVDTSMRWSAPVLLGIGTNPRVLMLRNMGVSLNGKYFVAWCDSGTIRGAVVTPGGVESSGTIAVTTDGVDSYDAGQGNGVIDVVYSARTDNSTWKMIRTSVTLPAVTAAVPETLTSVFINDPDPQFVQGVPSGMVVWTKTMGNDVSLSGSSLIPFSPQVLNNTGTAMKRGVRAYAVPVVTAKRSMQPSFLWITVLTYERDNGSDTVVVIHSPGYPGIDTIHSASYNRAPSSGSFFMPGNYILVVWESGRSGRAHIYGKLVYNPIGDVNDNDPALPKIFSLEQNYPNPFNPSTTITYQLPKDGMIRLSVFDLLGREVAVLKNGPEQSGRHRVTWDASRSASGIYFARLTTGQNTAVQKMVVMK